MYLFETEVRKLGGKFANFAIPYLDQTIIHTGKNKKASLDFGDFWEIVTKPGEHYLGGYNDDIDDTEGCVKDGPFGVPNDPKDTLII